MVPLIGGPPGGDDAYYHAMYAVEHARCLRAGVLFPRWYPDLNGGLGGPEPRPRPLLPLLLGGALALLLGDGVAAIVAVTAAAPALAGFVSLAALRRLGVAEREALLAAAAWAACPYLVASLHQRVALQEVLALALLPWVFAVLMPPGPRGRREVVTGALATACLLATQLLVAVMAAVAVASAHLLSRHRQPVRVALSGLVGAGLSALSWLPNVASLERVRGGSFVSGWFDWRTRFLFQGDAASTDLGRGFGWAFVGIVAAGLLLLSLRPSRLAAGIGLGCALLATPLTRCVWEVVPGFDLLQFPWRWLGVASCLVLVAAATSGSRRRRAWALVLLVVPLLATRPTRERLPAGPPLRPAAGATELARAATRFGVPPILPSFPAALPRDADPFEAMRAAAAFERAALVARERGPARWSWVATTDGDAPVGLPLLVDDGWEVRVDGRSVGWEPERSLVSVSVPAGEHVIDARQVLLAEDVGGIAVSAITALGLLVAVFVLPRARAGRAQ
jgi:hypothetical protein